ncbi:TIGR00153 family protein [Thiocystis violacea]|uniref:TIGR00153 family protein n=1 Tax=Thiocystis violacea TaxID=13725 RepID=UPI0019033E23|nr:TIGR00153 family protein [Thiocystis violacea]MBK1718592.1 TIGR00153 family protein [Thiocystis violacea]
MKFTNPIADLFGRSPFKPTQEHMRLVQACVSRLPSLIEALIADDTAALERIQLDIRDQAARASTLKKHIRLHLPRSLFMPVDRRELFDLLDLQDAIASGMREIADRLVERQTPVPPALGADLLALVQAGTAACRQSMAIVDELDELIETGFRGPEAERVEHMIEDLERARCEADDLGAGLARALFGLERDLDPVTLMRLSRLIRETVALAEGAEKVGDHLLPLIAR